MATISSRDQLKDYVLRRLGYPVININVDDAQVEDRIDDALQRFTEHHFDGVERRIIKHQITAQDITNQYVDLSGYTGGIASIVRVLEYDGGNSTNSLFDIKYQLHAQDYFGLRSGAVDLTTYDIAMTYVNTVNFMLNPEKTISFSKVTDKLQIETDWTTVLEGDYILLDAYVPLNPEQFTKIWDDPLLKDYVTALVKYQWGQNLSKFANMSLVGGVQFDAVRVMGEAREELKEVEQKLRDKYEFPPEFMVG